MKRKLVWNIGVSMGTVAFCFALSVAPEVHAQKDGATTAWRQGRFHVDVPGLIGRSDIFLGQPNGEGWEGLALGNGRRGVGVWSADGLTAQLNRADTLPDRLSPGQVIVPGLATLTAAKDYQGRLDLYHG